MFAVEYWNTVFDIQVPSGSAEARVLGLLDTTSNRWPTSVRSVSLKSGTPLTLHNTPIYIYPAQPTFLHVCRRFIHTILFQCDLYRDGRMCFHQFPSTKKRRMKKCYAIGFIICSRTLRQLLTILQLNSVAVDSNQLEEMALSSLVYIGEIGSFATEQMAQLSWVCVLHWWCSSKAYENS